MKQVKKQGQILKIISKTRVFNKEIKSILNSNILTSYQDIIINANALLQTS